MLSIKSLYKIGHGPSSSHTMGPAKIAKHFLDLYPEAEEFNVNLYGSLALTGKGHFTDKVIREVFASKILWINFDLKTKVEHPNTMEIIAYKDKKEVGRLRAFSLGGGNVAYGTVDNLQESYEHVYPTSLYSEIRQECERRKISLWDYILEHEGSSIIDYLNQVWNAMSNEVIVGLEQEGFLPGSLNLERRARKIFKSLFNIPYAEKTGDVYVSQLIYAYAYSASETNASGGIVVTAPTCGACGVIPGILFYCERSLNIPRERIIEALGVAGLIGMLFTTNGSIAGAVGGCQAEVGTACSMGAAAYAYLCNCNLDIIEKAAIIGIKHHLGLTCDPVLGYVQSPCIERNAIAAFRSFSSANLAQMNHDQKMIFSLDEMIVISDKTGRDLQKKYRETSQGGLASFYEQKIKKSKKK